MKKYWVLTLFLFAQPVVADYQAKVVGISDGDTLTVLRDSTQIKIRLHGIDCPEKGQPYANDAKRFASLLSYRQVVLIEEKGIDRYGRTIARVRIPDTRVLNEELVRRGFCWWYQRYDPQNKKMQLLERQARQKRIGLWADSAPVPPWDYRTKELQIRTSRSVVKKSEQGICHTVESMYYYQIPHFTSYASEEACVRSGGRSIGQ